ncbi:MAG: LysE family transporter [Cyclobacteriaceae bacterium]|nr:LysE family transporter [Cyclobacteriaceae bacterium]
MVIYLQVFLTGLVFSFVGSIPPGTLNVTVLQLGLDKKTSVALRFALAVAIIEYPYAWMAVAFEDWLTSSPLIIENFQLITAIVMTVLGLFTLWTSRKASTFSVKFSESGFRRGIILSLLNPMAIPYWMGATAYFKAQGWVDLSTQGFVHSYVFGTSVGAMLLLTLFIFLANRLSRYVQQNIVIKMLPGIIMLALGLSAFARYLF